MFKCSFAKYKSSTENLVLRLCDVYFFYLLLNQISWCHMFCISIVYLICQSKSNLNFVYTDSVSPSNLIHTHARTHKQLCTTKTSATSTIQINNLMNRSVELIFMYHFLCLQCAQCIPMHAACHVCCSQCFCCLIVLSIECYYTAHKHWSVPLFVSGTFIRELLMCDNDFIKIEIDKLYELIENIGDDTNKICLCLISKMTEFIKFVMLFCANEAENTHTNPQNSFLLLNFFFFKCPQLINT